MSKFYYIVFEGIDGAGKSTQIMKLSQHMKELNITPILLAEPTLGQYGSKMRFLKESISKEEERKIFTLDRKEHIEYKISPLLKLMDSLKPNCGLRIIQSRSFYCSPAYQGTDEASMIKDIEEQKEFAPTPDIVFLLDIPVEKAIARLKNRGDKRRSIFENPERLNKAKENYLFIAHRESVFKVINGSKTEDAVFKEIEDSLDLKHFNPA